MTTNELLQRTYTDNSPSLKVGDRLRAEIEDGHPRLWVASGYFSAPVWNAMNGALDGLSEFRLLLGASPDYRGADAAAESAHIRRLVEQAVRKEASEPPKLINRVAADEAVKFIAFLERMRENAKDTGKPEVIKLWQGDGFLHAKAYILQNEAGRAGSVGIGSANFTWSGLSREGELVGWRQDRTVLTEVKEWYEQYWNDGEDFTDGLIELLRSSPAVSDGYSPYELLIRTLAARYGIDRPPSLDSATLHLKWFQEDAVFRAIRMLDGPARGALVADAVGLGKTFVAMGVIHHFLYRRVGERRGEGKPVLIVAPASLLEMWERELRKNNLDWACELVSMQMLRDTMDESEYGGADLVVFDEAHRLRGGGTWYRKALDIVRSGKDYDQRRVLLLTATPVNTSMDDLIRQLNVLAKNRQHAWAPQIADYERFLKRCDRGEQDPLPLLDRCVVRRSRSDIIRAQDEARAAGAALDEVKLPERKPSHIDYDYGDQSKQLFDVFATGLRSMRLAPYDLERFKRRASSDDEATADAFLFRPGSLAALCAAGLLFRFQSSIPAITKSLHRVDAVLRRTAEALATNPPKLLDLSGDRRVRELLDVEKEGDTDEVDVDGRWGEVIDGIEPLANADDYDLTVVAKAIEQDRAIVAELLAIIPSEDDDGKIDALIGALHRVPRGGVAAKGKPALGGTIPLVFSQFRDTAQYLERRLRAEGFNLVRIDGSTPTKEREHATQWFDPARAGQAQTKANISGEIAPQMMVCTDVLAEGHNLQLADCVVNFDVGFNPQVVVQRAGRVDRIGSTHDFVHLVSMMPPGNLETHIGLVARIDERFRRIHGMGLGDEQVTQTKGDRQVVTLEQLRRLYVDDDAKVLDEIERDFTIGSTDYMRSPLDSFLNSAARESIERIPYGVSSVKRMPRDGWSHGPGVFIAFSLGSSRKGKHDSVVEDTHWRFYPRVGDAWGTAVGSEVELFRAIACKPNEPRAEGAWPSDGPTVIDWELLARAAGEVTQSINEHRTRAMVAHGASERSRELRMRLRSEFMGVGDIDGASDLLERLNQVRIEDYRGVSGWREFDAARKQLSGAETTGDQREAAELVIGRGLGLFGRPQDEDDETGLDAEVQIDELRLVSYEAIVLAPEPSAAEQLEMPE